MHCDNPNHAEDEHVWPTEHGAMLQVALCERYCQYCPSEKAGKKWRESKDLLRHLRSAAHAEDMKRVELVTVNSLKQDAARARKFPLPRAPTFNKSRRLDQPPPLYHKAFWLPCKLDKSKPWYFHGCREKDRKRREAKAAKAANPFRSLEQQIDAESVAVTPRGESALPPGFCHIIDFYHWARGGDEVNWGNDYEPRV